MKVLQINTVYFRGSTGKIAGQIQKESAFHGIQNIVAHRYNEGIDSKDTYCISSWFDCHVHNRIARYTHRVGFYSRLKTKRFLRYIDCLKPDVIHIHVIHGAYINIGMLFSYIREHGIKTIWTFHDCWPFTGHCPYYERYHCYNWQKDCGDCPCSTSRLNRNSSWKNLEFKKSMVEGLDLTVVSPSKWLAGVINRTFYSGFDVRVIYNGVDLTVFKPTKSDFRKKYNIPENKRILLGVASGWNERKGIDVFAELAKRLSSDSYQIVLVGTTEADDAVLPDNIVSIHRTNNQTELACIYTAADLFVNPTREEVLGMVNIEANACGTPVVTYDSGGSPECINERSGAVVERDNIDALEKTIRYICENTPYSAEECIENAKRFDCKERFKEYIELYSELAGLNG